MPLYVYRCEKCGHQFEEMRKVSDPNPPCPCTLGNLRGEDIRVWFGTVREDLLAGKSVPRPVMEGESVYFLNEVGVAEDLPAMVSPDMTIRLMNRHTMQMEDRTAREWAQNEEPCGGETTKLITGGTFHLKGSGWASDGYS